MIDGRGGCGELEGGVGAVEAQAASKTPSNTYKTSEETARPELEEPACPVAVATQSGPTHGLP